MNITEQTLLEGSWWALEQAGRLLGSATMLFESGDFSTALAVAMFGREELGRSHLLRDCAGEVRAGKLLQPDEIKSRCQDHVKKQEASASQTKISTPPGSALARVSRDLNKYDPGSEQWQEAYNAINSAHDAKRRRQPHQRHEARCSSLYVDLNDQGTAWLRPNITKDEAYNEITTAIGEYTHEVELLIHAESNPTLEQRAPRLSLKAMSSARSKMSPPVDIPRPSLPTFNAGHGQQKE
jgi:AbiV family abortive infection protein